MCYLTLEDAVCRIKERLEKSIVDNGLEGKNNLIRSQALICFLHDAVKADFIRQGVNPSSIKPFYGEHKGEMSIAGFFKCKNQDICILPDKYKQKEEVINTIGILKGYRDPYGFEFTERILSINVRSQLSSLKKNFDTLYERTIAEALNLHLRCHRMTLGEVYMIPVFEYDDCMAKDKKIAFKTIGDIQEHIQKYIYAFQAINRRNNDKNMYFKYERVCLLIVDFKRKNPKIYTCDEELMGDGLLSNTSDASLHHMDFKNFSADLLKIYQKRFGEGIVS